MVFEIKQVTGKYILNNWEAIFPIISINFDKAKFNNDFSIESIRNEILEDCCDKKFKHLLLYDSCKKIAGGIFSIPQIKTDSDYCDVGWFFTSSNLSNKLRLQSSDIIINYMHQMVRNVGYIMIRTQIGTKKGENILSKRYGYKRIDSVLNIWEKIL